MWSSSLLVLPDQSRVWVDTETAVVEFTDAKGKCLMLLFIVPRVSGGIIHVYAQYVYVQYVYN